MIVAVATVKFSRALAFMALPAVAVAAEGGMRPLDGSLRFWVAAMAVMVLALAGYSASSLPQWAQWLDDTGGPVVIRERRLKIVQGLVIALLAGNIAYYGGFYYLAIAEVACFIAAALGAYAGDRFLNPLVSRMTGGKLPLPVDPSA